jgi:phosphatidylserine/phosphatidylglycerophosphate/cardiolipin synthase-like enzyme
MVQGYGHLGLVMNKRIEKLNISKLPLYQAGVFPIINSEYIPFIISLVDSAQSTIDILMFSAKYYRGKRNHVVNAYWHALQRAAARGVVIRLLLNANFYLGGNLRDNQFIVQSFRKDNFQTAFSGKSTRLHSKMFIVDDEYVLVGSHNTSQRAFNANFETSIAVKSGPLAKVFKIHFERLWKSRVETIQGNAAHADQ